MRLKMENWFFLMLMVLVFWGLWAFFPKVALLYIKDTRSITLYETMGVATAGLAILVWIFARGERPEFHATGFIFAFLTGVFAIAGLFLFISAMVTGKASIIITITALYPIVSVPLCYFLLKEPLSPRQGIGIVFALVAVILVAGGGDAKAKGPMEPPAATAPGGGAPATPK